jgi:hypothetical protein
MRLLLFTFLMSAAVPAIALGQEDKSLANQARAVLKRYCHQCHSGPGSDSGEGNRR